MPKTILKAKKIANTIAVSSAEAERGFSLMNTIVTKLRTSLTIDHIADLMSINLLGKPVNDFDATPMVKSWINENHRLATETRVKKRAEKKFSENEVGIWSLY